MCKINCKIEGRKNEEEDVDEIFERQSAALAQAATPQGRNFYRCDVTKNSCISFSSKHERNGGKCVIYREHFSRVFLTAASRRRVNAIITEGRRIRDNGGARNKK